MTAPSTSPPPQASPPSPPFALLPAPRLEPPAAAVATPDVQSTDGGAAVGMKVIDLPAAGAGSVGDITGPARVDRRGDRMLARLTSRDIAVIDMIDIDLDTARALVARHPLAIVNASTSATGRAPALGPMELVEAGIRLVDEVGSHLLAMIDDGEPITVTADGRILRGGRQVAAGRAHDEASVARAARQGRTGLGAQLAAFGACAPAVFEEERHLLLPPGPVESATSSPDYFPPQIRALLRQGGRRGRKRATTVGRRPAVVVLPGPRAAVDSRAIARFARGSGALIVAAADGAQQAMRARMRPDVVVGDGSVLPDNVVASATVVVHLAGPRSRDTDVGAATARLHRLGAAHTVWRTGLPVEDAATVLAVSANSAVVVLVGSRRGLLEFAEQGPVGMAGAALTRAAWGHRIVDVSVARRLVRPGPSRQLAITLLGAGVLAVGAAAAVVSGGLDVSGLDLGSLVGGFADSESSGSG